ncbi:MAG: tripartite tricarboxylate transporter substrate binding protein, partial [Burkholderiales bacterium]|nr:tripartite tricarboxylate transporter substrate binding protein [Burkholderiales bacterium]
MRVLFLLALLFLSPGIALAQAWPQKPVRMVVAFPPGGSTDISVRALSERIAPALGQPVIVENRTGAGGNVAAEYVLKQPADGYTVLATADSLASNPHLYRLSFDPRRDFAPVMQLTRQPVVLGAHPSLGVNTLAELIALAKAKPGLAYATSGAGSIQHMAGEWFAKLAEIKLTHVPYKGGGQAITDLLGAQVPLGSLGNTPLLPHYRSGKLKILAQTTARRSPSLPDVPTYAESGLKDLVLEQWLGLFVIAGTPAEAVTRLNAEANRGL